jgi:hypothetical protein
MATRQDEAGLGGRSGIRWAVVGALVLLVAAAVTLIVVYGGSGGSAPGY